MPIIVKKPEWFIKLNGKEIGPLTVKEVCDSPGITFDTLVWKEGFLEWCPLGKVDELVTEMEQETTPAKMDDSGSAEEDIADSDVLTANQEPPNFLIWLALLVLILVYALFRVYN